MARIYATEYWSASYDVSFEVDPQHVKHIYEECRENGDSFEDFIDAAKEFIDDNRWDYQYDRDMYNEDSNDFEWGDGWSEFEEELRDYFEDYDTETVTIIGDFGNE